MIRRYWTSGITLAAVAMLAAVALFGGGDRARADDETVAWALPTTSSLTISVGDTVTWNWSDSLPHTVTSQTGPATFTSGAASTGDTFAFTFSTAGTYTYHCNVHLSGMTGTIVVQAAASPTATATATSTTTTATPTATTTATPAATTAATSTATRVATSTPTAAATQVTSPTPGAPATGSGSGSDGSFFNLALLLGAAAVLAAGTLAGIGMLRRR